MLCGEKHLVILQCILSEQNHLIQEIFSGLYSFDPRGLYLCGDCMGE